MPDDATTSTAAAGPDERLSRNRLPRRSIAPSSASLYEAMASVPDVLLLPRNCEPVTLAGPRPTNTTYPDDPLATTLPSNTLSSTCSSPAANTAATVPLLLRMATRRRVSVPASPTVIGPNMPLGIATLAIARSLSVTAADGPARLIASRTGSAAGLVMVVLSRPAPTNSIGVSTSSPPVCVPNVRPAS